jgi:aerobic-type carbon monoxide dehydrogenase small subunit (CoxS/CutS family)
MTHNLRVQVNGVDYERQVAPNINLADFLRHDLGLTGTHLGCEHGVCGACTVLLNGESVRSCLLYAVQVDGQKIMTVEGLSADQGPLHPLQQAFRDHHALQCGFCTPGMLMTVMELLSETPDPSEAEVRDAISGNLCRCTGYQSIVEATLAAAKNLGKGTGA